ncbi:hypothetical protein JHK82_055509 [Glycine max]|nr:hypothetical protein JHK82_055509 [Glycine max]
MSFNPHQGMILNEIQAMVAPYMFGANKDNSIDGEEQIVRTAYSISANRQTLRTLMPNGLLDQEDDNKTRMELALDVVLDALQHNER